MKLLKVELAMNLRPKAQAGSLMLKLQSKNEDKIKTLSNFIKLPAQHYFFSLSWYLRLIALIFPFFQQLLIHEFRTVTLKLLQSKDKNSLILNEGLANRMQYIWQVNSEPISQESYVLPTLKLLNSCLCHENKFRLLEDKIQHEAAVSSPDT